MADIAGFAYDQLVKDQLEEERKTKESLEKRGEWVIASAGALLTVLFGLSAIVTGVQDYTLSPGARWLLQLAVLPFLCAGVLAVIINFPMTLLEVSVTGLRAISDQPAYWTAPQEIGLRRSAQVRVGVLASARQANSIKSRLLQTAMALEVVGVALVGFAVLIIL